MSAGAAAVGAPPRDAGAAAKAPDAFRTIGEVAEDLAVPQHVLRFWETRFPQIRPLKRGGGRRYYRRDDVALVSGVRTLLYGHGYTIKGVQRILREGGVRHVQAVGRGEAAVAPPSEGPFEVASPAPIAAADAPDWADRASLEPAMPELTATNRDALAMILDELLECRRVLDGLRPDADPT